jgi:peptidoglycan biosynthesis protein MviN/MurJ (putative lipid II flippase)
VHSANRKSYLVIYSSLALLYFSRFLGALLFSRSDFEKQTTRISLSVITGLFVAVHPNAIKLRN